jgi:hypothetical protein
MELGWARILLPDHHFNSVAHSVNLALGYGESEGQPTSVDPIAPVITPLRRRALERVDEEISS